VNTGRLNRGGLAALAHAGVCGLGVAGMLGTLALVTAVTADVPATGAGHGTAAAHGTGTRGLAARLGLAPRPAQRAEYAGLLDVVRRTAGGPLGDSGSWRDRSHSPGAHGARPGEEAASWGDANLTGSTGNQKGFSVAISGSIAVISLPGLSQNAGAAYIYERTGNTWLKKATLPDPRGFSNDEYAWAVAVSSTKAGNYVVIGGNDTNGQRDYVYVYTGSGSTWTQQAKIGDPGPSSSDMFGDALAISGTTLVVGASCVSQDSGAAYIYERTGTRWSLKNHTVDPVGKALDSYGGSVAVSGGTVMVGAVGNAYVYTSESGIWVHTATIHNPSTDGQDNFGESVALTGTTGVIGAPGTPPGSSTLRVGAAYVYRESGTTWKLAQKLTPPAGTPGFMFGNSTALNSTKMVVGMPLYGTNNCGAAFSFSLSGGRWAGTGRQADPGCAGRDLFGFAVGLSGSYAAYGAPDTSNNAGASYELPLP
jgi:FG-GAP repeat protein